jgi:hypothetical protein
MMTKFILLALVALTSCSYQYQKPLLQGNYQENVYQNETLRSFDDTWSRLIDLFAQKGLSVKIIDKSSGLIISEKTSFLSSYTYEDQQGKPINSNAFVAVSNLKSVFGTSFTPTVLTGDWNVRIKQGEGKTVVNVNLVNIVAGYTAPASMYDTPTTLELDAKSTGVFERLIADQLK